MGSRAVRDALANLPSRLPVNEHEIMRISGTLVGADSNSCAQTARNEVLRWAQKHCGGQLPEAAWELEDFEYLSGGRDTIGVRIKVEKSDIWALRSDDPDKTIPGRIWTTEVTVAVLGDELARFGARLLVSTSEAELDIEPHTPGFVRQISENCGLVCGTYSVDADPWIVADEQDLERLIEKLVDPQRSLPFFVLSVPGAAPEDAPLINAQILAQAVIGLAQVVVVPKEFTWGLTTRFEKSRSVFGGAARVYLPGFEPTSNPYDHRLIIAKQISTPKGAARAERWMRSLAARESIRRSALGRDALAFSAIRSAALQLQQQRLVKEGASESELLAAATAQIAALERQLDEEKAAQEYYVREHDRAEERATAAEEQLRASAFRIQDLIGRLQNSDQSTEDDSGLPNTWSEFASWADVALSGRLTLAPVARRQVRSPQFQDVQLAARCLVWLATECRDRRVSGGEGSLGEETVEAGIRNAHCGNDEFDFYWQGREHTADWHIKSGGNTRDPTRCLRIYYGWDEATKQIVVAEMPAHRRTGAS